MIEQASAKSYNSYLSNPLNFFTHKANSRVDFGKSERRSVFHILLIRPTRYDDEGYPIQWVRSAIPSNSLACLNGLALDAAERDLLGSDVELRVSTFDEGCDVLDYEQLIQDAKKAGQKMLACMVGVQTNQYPRAVDVSRRFSQQDVPVCIGGFHISGVLNLLGKPTEEMLEAQQAGISLFAGEAEDGRFDEVIQDAWKGTLKPLYDYGKEMPGLENQPRPRLPKVLVNRNFSGITTIDLGRGCPFQCSFCCIINVQGRTSRSRSADDLEDMVRQAWEQGMTRVVISDDDFARNKDWELLFDRLIKLREEDIKLMLFIQIDTQAYKLPGFVEKAVAAGVEHVFIGLENINPDNLKSIQKRQNKITEYRQMLLEWKKHKVLIWGGNIIGFPNDTFESVMRDTEIIKRELPIDILNTTILTPLPGSMDHKEMHEKGIWMDPDLNKYDLAHRVTNHPRMTDDELDRLNHAVWDAFYTREHRLTVVKRAFAMGSNKKVTLAGMLTAVGIITKVNGIRSYDMGLIRQYVRKDRRPGLPVENPFVFYPRMFWKVVSSVFVVYRENRWLLKEARAFWNSDERTSYMDDAIKPVEEDDFGKLEMYQETRGGKEAVAKAEARLAAKAARNANVIAREV